MEKLNKQEIINWLHRIEQSELPTKKFLETYDVPFSERQYYRYKAFIIQNGIKRFDSDCSHSRNRKIFQREEDFLKGVIAENPQVDLNKLQRLLRDHFDCNISIPGIKQALTKFAPDYKTKRGRPKSIKIEPVINSFGGFELIIARAIYLKWPQRVEKVISQEIKNLKNRELYQSNIDHYDCEGRDEEGKFTENYNKRKDIRENRFASVTEKRLRKNFTTMSIIRDKKETIIRKNLAMLALPVITLNGNVRTVDLALGQSLKHICGFDYKQKTIEKFLNELKYIGISTRLLFDVTHFWKETWSQESKNSMMGPLLCYYIDGNTKALWSSYRVKKNKVTMLGRIMGCLEQVFIHDGFGHPIYFETYSGTAKVGEYILNMFEKIEEVIMEVPNSRTQVNRVIIMDPVHNSVKTLRAFSKQKKYYYITLLDENQWKQRRIIQDGNISRYRYGKATLREVIIELIDSTEENYLISSRAIRIDWDNGKVTVLLSNLPQLFVDSSELVYAYFRRWPCQETQFKIQKSVVSINRVAGYGKKKVDDINVMEKLSQLEKRINELQESLAEPLEQISLIDEKIAQLVTEEVNIKKKCTIKDGKRIVPKAFQQKLIDTSKEINKHQRIIQKINKKYKTHLNLLKKHQKTWFRLQGKEQVYEVDVELDQIVTFYRISLANLYAYFIKHFLEDESLSMIMLLHRIIHLQGSIIESDSTRKITLQYNKKDPHMMKKLEKTLIKINQLNIRGPRNKLMHFSLEVPL